ncbi:MAG: tRNA (adenosine(37)-N6)-dimethylallyltransferase MiaA [Clostridia bacterium]|nr:tRNA (adenosine(37)-N6)-dimethylallyltransferase MiaA [Clostridia bacterium]
MINIKDLIVITGPTASGKTAMSVEVAKILGAEIVNADSMQIYKYMDIGTAKPTVEERQGIPHHLIDIVNPDEQFSVARYCECAKQAIDSIHKKGKPAVMVGGTGLYVDSLVNNIQFSEIEPDEEYRAKTDALAEEKGNEYIYNMLMEIDPDSAGKISVSDRKRIIRALEVYHLTGKTITWHNEQSRSVPSPYNTTMFAIDVERDVLYDKINRRVDIMMDMGLVDEVKSIVEMGIGKDTTAMQAIGYKEIVQYLEGEITMEEAVDKIKQGSRRYAKRQLTWYRRNENVHWVKGIDEVLKILNK